MSETNKKNLFKFLVLLFFYLIAQAAMFSFGSALFKSRGLNASLIGSVCSVETACSFIGFILLGAILSKVGKTKVPIIIFLIISLVTYILLYFYTRNPFVFILFGLLGFIFDPVYAFIDSWILSSGKDTFKSFAKIKTIATFTYSCFFIVLSLLIDKLGYAVCLVTSVLCLLICIITALFIPDFVKDTNIEKHNNDLSTKEIIRGEFKYMGTYLIISFVMGLACTSLLTYVPHVLDSIGASTVYQGLGLFLCYCGSSLFTILSVKIEKIDILVKSIVGVLFMVFGLLLINFFPCVFTLLLGCFFRGVADALIMISLRNYVKKFVPNNLQTFSHSMVNAFHCSLGGAVGIGISGALFEKYGFSGMATFCCAAAVISIIISIFVFIINKKKSTKVLE